MNEEPTNPADGTPEILPKKKLRSQICGECGRSMSPSRRDADRRARKRGRPGQDDVNRLYRDALDAVHDPEKLLSSPLFKLPIVKLLGAQYEAKGRILPYSRALQTVERRALADIARDLPGTHLAGLAQARYDGLSQAEFARAAGIREEYITRTLKPRLVLLLRLQVEAIQKRFLADLDGDAGAASLVPSSGPVPSSPQSAQGDADVH